jgi:hypothetical protein
MAESCLGVCRRTHSGDSHLGGAPDAIDLAKPGGRLVPTDAVLVHHPSFACDHERASGGKPSFAFFVSTSLLSQRARVSVSEGCPPKARSSEGGLAERQRLSCRCAGDLNDSRLGMTIAPLDMSEKSILHPLQNVMVRGSFPVRRYTPPSLPIEPPMVRMQTEATPPAAFSTRTSSCPFGIGARRIRSTPSWTVPLPTATGTASLRLTVPGKHVGDRTRQGSAAGVD